MQTPKTRHGEETGPDSAPTYTSIIPFPSLKLLLIYTGVIVIRMNPQARAITILDGLSHSTDRKEPQPHCNWLVKVNMYTK